MMTETDGRRNMSDDPNRRRIGFGARDDDMPRREPAPMRGGYMGMEPTMPHYPPNVYNGRYNPMPVEDDDRRMHVYRSDDQYKPDQRRQEHGAQYGHHNPDEDDGSYQLTRDKAVKWMQSLKNEDPAHPTGPRWKMEEVKPLAARYGINEGTEEFIEFWATMNMLYSDYFPIFREYNIVQPEAFAKMAKAFLQDKDALDHKLGRYYNSIVRK